MSFEKKTKNGKLRLKNFIPVILIKTTHEDI